MWWIGAALAGTLVDEVRCEASPDHRYALYLPDGWTAERRWPVLIVLDPRGQAVPALELLIPTADRDGLVVASSYDSRSDTLDLDPTPAAASAMLADLPRTASIATDQVILLGFSGTARSAWAIGEVAPQIVAGVFGTGGATPDGGLPTAVPPFPWAGAAGTTDFNWQEARRAADWIGDHGGRSVFLPFPGPHGWPGPEVLDQAVRWLEGEAYARGRWPFVPAPAQIPSMEPYGDQGRIGEWEDQIRRDLADVEAWFRDPHRQPPGLQRARTMLHASALERRSQRDDPWGHAAGRMLAIMRARFLFYLARDLQLAGELERLDASVRLGIAIGEALPEQWYNLACLRAERGAVDEAFAALDEAVARGFRDADWTRRDPDLEPLRADPRFEALLARMTATAP